MYGKRIRELRQERGLTQSQLAEKVSTTASTIGKYEREQLQPNVDILKSMCDFFGVSAGYLLGFED